MALESRVRREERLIWRCQNSAKTGALFLRKYPKYGQKIEKNIGTRLLRLRHQKVLQKHETNHKIAINSVYFGAVAVTTALGLAALLPHIPCAKLLLHAISRNHQHPPHLAAFCCCSCLGWGCLGPHLSYQYVVSMCAPWLHVGSWLGLLMNK